MPKIQEPKSGQLIITIPKQIAKLMGWKKGTEILFNYEAERIILKEVGDIAISKVKK